MTNAIILISSQIAIAYCLSLVNDYLGLAYIVHTLASYAMAVNKYFAMMEQAKKMEKQIKEVINEHNKSAKSNDDSSKDSKS